MKHHIKSGLTFTSKFLLFVLTVIILYWSWLFVFKPIKQQHDIKVGDLYIYEPDDQNPFDIKEPKFYRIIDRKGKYVKYIDESNYDTLSMSIRMFLYDAKKAN